MAVLASELDTYVKGNWPVLGVYGPDLRDAPRLILNGIKLLGDAAIQVRYEDLAKAPEETISQLCTSLGIEFHESMLNYASTAAPKGVMNDPVGVHRHTRPSTTSLEKWLRLAGDPQSRHFALAYLDDLGRETIAAFGYSFDDIKAALTGDQGDGRQVRLFPWSLAVTPKDQWTARQRFQAELYFAIGTKGRLRGTASTVRKTARRWIRTVRAEWARS
jgi:hypothetical protein